MTGWKIVKTVGDYRSVRTTVEDCGLFAAEGEVSGGDVGPGRMNRGCRAWKNELGIFPKPHGFLFGGFVLSWCLLFVVCVCFFVWRFPFIGVI